MVFFICGVKYFNKSKKKNFLKFLLQFFLHIQITLKISNINTINYLTMKKSKTFMSMIENN